MQEAKAPGAESSNQLKARLSKGLFELNLKLASCKSGALVQVWMPEVTADGSMVLSAQGLPFAIAGIGDLLALFRCVSCRYRFSTDVTRPALMGAIGRVYSSCEPEMSHNVQKYDKQVYLRVSEAQRCRVHSTLVMPVFDGGDGDSSSFGARPVAVFELVQADKDVAFPAVIAELRKCLEDVGMFTSEPDVVTASVGLRKWPMHIDSSAFLRELSADVRTAHSNSAGRLLLENDIPDDEGPTGPAGQAAAAAEAAAAGALGGMEPMIIGSAAAARAASSSISHRQPVVSGGDRELPTAAADMDAEMAAAGAGSGQGSAHTEEAGPTVVPAAAAAAAVHADDAPPQQKAAAVTAAGKAAVDSKDEAQSKQSLPAAGTQQQQQQDDANSPALTTQILNALTTAATNIQSQAQQQHQVQPQQQQLTLDLSALLVNSMQAILSQHTQAMQGLQQQQQQSQQQQPPPPQQQQAALPAGAPDPTALSSAISTLIAAASAQSAAAGTSPGAAANNQPLLAAVQQLQLLQQQLGGTTTEPHHAQQSSQQQQGAMRRSGSSAANLSRAAAAAGEDVGSDDELFGSDDDDDGGFGKASRFGGSSSVNAANRPMGAGRKLTFEDLQAQFGLGLKEAAANLGICATTLKRACRRNGITRWPRRQIQKLNRTINQMGQQGAQGPAIDELVQSAIRKNLKPDMLTPAVTASLQQQLLQQANTAAAATRSSSGAMPILRVGSSSARYNSGSLTGMGGLTGSLGDGQTGGALGMLGGSAGALGNGLGNGGLGGFVGFSFPPGGDSSMGLGGALMNDQQQLLLQQLQQQQQTAAALAGMGGNGNLQLLLSGMLPPQDLQQQQQQHLQILQSQAALAQGGSLQQLMQQQPVDGLASVPALYQQQQQLLLQQQQQHSMQGAISNAMMMPPAFKNTAAAGSGGGGNAGDNMNGSTMQGPGVNAGSMGFPLQQQQQQHQDMVPNAGFSMSAAAAEGGMSNASGKLHSPAGVAASEHADSVALQQQQGVTTPMTTAAAEAAAAHFGDLVGNSGDGFFDLLDDGMLLDEAGLDLSGFAAFEQQQ